MHGRSCGLFACHDCFAIFTQSKKQVVLHLKDLVDKMCILDPDKRMSTNEALAHPFISQTLGRK
jgi:serine/threonine protein kinase